MSSPTIFGGNNTSTLLQNQLLMASGQLIQNDGAKNYITYNNFQNGLTTGWSLFNTSLTSGLPTGSISAGAASLALTASATSTLADTYSLTLTAAGATTAGQGFISDTFTLNDADMAQALTWAFSYRATSGTSNVNWSGILGSQTFGVYLYDVTNSAWVQPSGFLGMNTGTGANSVTGTFQSNALVSGNTYRLAVISLQASAGACTLVFDRFFLGPQTRPIGFVGTDAGAQPVTITGSWSANTTYTAKGWRVGDRQYLDITIATTGTPTTAALTVNLPNSIDTTKLTSTSGNRWLGTGLIVAGGGTVQTLCDITYGSATTVGIRTASTSTTGGWVSVTQAVPAAFANGDVVQLWLSYPVVGWSSNVQMSSDTASQVVSSRMTGSSTSIPNGGTYTIVGFTTTDFDTTGSLTTGASAKYTAPVSGIYQVAGYTQWGASGPSTGLTAMAIFKNGVQYSEICILNGALGGFTSLQGADSIKLVAGDYIDIRLKQAGSGAVSLSGATGAALSVERVSGPSVIAASDTVAAFYSGTCTGTLNGSYNLATFPTKQLDTTSSYSAGTYTVPISGVYSINATAQLNGTYVLNQNANIQISVNGAALAAADPSAGGAVSKLNPLVVVGAYRLKAGDLVTFECLTQGTGPSFGSGCRMSIARIGN